MPDAQLKKKMGSDLAVLSDKIGSIREVVSGDYNHKNVKWLTDLTRLDDKWEALEKSLPQIDRMSPQSKGRLVANLDNLKQDVQNTWNKTRPDLIHK